MTLPLEPNAAAMAVVWGGLLLGLLLGALAQSTRFCTMGAIADWFSFGGTARMLMWVLAIAVAATGSLVLIEMSWLDATKTNAWSTRLLWVSNTVGGLIFGFGMVLAAGCPQRNLVKAGAGNLKAWVTLLVAAVSAQMTLRGVLSELRVGFFDTFNVSLNTPQDVASILVHGGAWDVGQLRWLVLGAYLVIAGALLWRNRRSMEVAHWVGGAGVGLLVVAAWCLTAYVGFIAEHPETLEPSWSGTYSHRPEALSFAAPLAHSLDLLTLWSDRNNVATYGVTVCLGTLLGSAAAALMRHQFHIESFSNSTDMVHHIAGGVLIGFGGVTAMGCSIGQGISGLALQSAGAILAVAGITAGAWLGLRYQAWQLDR